MSSDEEFLRELQATFKVEAADHVRTIEKGLLDLEAAPASSPMDLIGTVFRAAHSLKGAARAVDLVEIESHCQLLEDIFASWKSEKSVPGQDSFDRAHRTLDAIAKELASDPAPKTLTPPTAPPAPVITVAPPPQREPARTGTAIIESRNAQGEETVRISVAKLDARLLEAEEMLAVKLLFDQRTHDLQTLRERFSAWRNEWSTIEPDARALRQAAERRTAADGTTRMLDFLEWTLEYVRSLEGDVAALHRKSEHDRFGVGKMVDGLLTESKNLLLLPFATVTASFPKLVRDLCRDQGKEVDLFIRGEDVEIDKRILEDMKDPLIHLLRNAVDHGAELPAMRAAAGKPTRSTVTITATPLDGNKVELVIADDGAGIDVDNVKAAAVRQGILSADDAARLDRDAARDLIFRSDVSTSPIITRLSGRGIGLAIMREKAQKLGGTVTVESTPGRGTQFRVVVPLLLATFRGVIVQAAGRQFLIPSTQVECVARVRDGDVKTVEGRETLALDGKIFAWVRLANVLEIADSGAPAPNAGMTAVIIGGGNLGVAFAVDAVLDEQEVLVKPLRKPLVRVRNIAGATVLGSGQVIPVLNVADLLLSARQAAARGTSELRAAPKPKEARSILVAEDSITSRMLIKNILENAGFRVKTAVDGMDALALLRGERFDAVISDVEMPRLNGFALTSRIRADRKLADLPVILVTALESREDRERGIEVGANAYIVKSTFDQSNLLDAIRRLA